MAGLSAAGGAGIVWVRDPTHIVYNMKKMRQQIPAKAARVMREFADETTEWMQENAPWQDQSGAARGSLIAQVAFVSQDVVRMEAGYDLEYLLANQYPSRQRDYSIYLEGYLNLSILEPTQNEKFPHILDRLPKAGFVDF